MKPHPRIRKTIKWGGAAVTVLLVVVWIWDGQLYVNWMSYREKSVNPIWQPLAVALLATATAWWLDTLARRRGRPGLCPTCQYDRTGLPPGAVCPECGAAAPKIV